ASSELYPLSLHDALPIYYSDVHAERNGPQRDGVAPHFCDLVARLRHDLDRADACRVDNHRHVTGCDWSSDQRREPCRHTIAPCGVGGANWAMCRERRAASVLYDDPHVAYEPQLRAEISEEFFRGHLLLH